MTGAADFYSPSLPSGTRLKGGAFAIGEVLGQGGFGITYKGGDMGLRRYVAIKEFFPHGSRRRGATVVPGAQVDAASFEAARKGFIKEAMTLARFNHAGIVRVFGAFEENGTAYMVMEMLEGQSLKNRLDEKGVVPEKEAVSIIAQVGVALEAVHVVGMLHRDIKPDNIVLTNDSRVVLIDFGTVREFAADKTRSMTAMVTPGYAPLEQYTNQARFGAFTDVYALGATLYHCLTGQLPASSMDRVAGVDLPSPDRVNPNLSRGVSQATMRALEVNSGDRFQSINEFLGALQAGVSAPPNPIPAPDPVPVATVTGVWNHNGPTAAPPADASTPNPPPYSSTCPHCGAEMSTVVTICPKCHRSKLDPVGSAHAPLHERPDTLFDRVMFAVPTWAWRTLGVAVVLAVGGRTTVGVIRYQNGGRDFGPELAVEMMKEPGAAPLTKATLQLGKGVYDDVLLKKRHDDYVGEVRYRDGDVGTLKLDVKSRDWLYKPEKFEFKFEPKDFGELIGGQIRSETNNKLHPNDSTLLMTEIYLSRQSRTEYSGNYVMEQRSSRSHRDDIQGSVKATVLTFHEDGSPATWNYALD